MSVFPTCPRCNHQGHVRPLFIKRTREVVHVCDECDALWLKPLRDEPRFEVDFIDFKTYLDSHNVNFESSEWESAHAV